MSQLEVHTHLEIHGYGMKYDTQGSRLIEPGETADFYDVSLLQYFDETGEVHPIVEIDDMLSFDVADHALERLAIKYPRALNCGWCHL